MLKFGLGDVVRVNKNGCEYTGTVHCIFPNGSYVYKKEQTAFYALKTESGSNITFNDEMVVKIVFSRKYKIGQSVRANVYNNNVKSNDKTRYGVIVGYQNDETAMIRFGVDTPIPVAVSAIADKYDNALMGYRFGVGASYHTAAGYKTRRNIVSYKDDKTRYYKITSIYMLDDRTAYSIESVDGKVNIRDVRMSKLY